MIRLGKFGGGTALVWLLTGLLMSAVWVQPAAAQGSGSATLDAAKGRGQVLCGVVGPGARLFFARQPRRDEGTGRGYLPRGGGGSAGRCRAR